MLLNSFVFGIVFVLFFSIFWLIPTKRIDIRNSFLLIVSYMLYMKWKPVFAIALLGVTIICFSGAILIEELTDKKRRAITILFVVLGLFPLLLFKYYNFLNGFFLSVFERIGIHLSLPGLNWAIPIGISFFTFQSVGYVLDVYKERVTAEKNFLTFALFVSFFPQIVSGPISTANELMPQFKQVRSFNYENCRSGFRLFLWGVFLKSVIADRSGIYVDMIWSSYDSFLPLNCLIAVFLYSIQIYSDFAGYTYMAIGVARALGFQLPQNFNRPYFAASVTEFWHRWHISLTRWLTTHVYIGLGGNRCSMLRQYANILITFLVSGIWHGANWTFVLWGLIHGTCQVIEKFLFGERVKKEVKQPNHSLSFSRLLRVFATFVLVSFIWVFFRADTVNDAIMFLSKPFDIFQCGLAFSSEGMATLLYLIIGLPILLIFEFCKEYKPSFLSLIDANTTSRWIAYVFLIVTIVLIGVHDSSQFIYVSF